MLIFFFLFKHACTLAYAKHGFLTLRYALAERKPCEGLHSTGLWLVTGFHESVTRRKLQTPGSATVGKEQNGRRTPSSSTLKSNDREFAQRTDQAPGTIKTAAQESSRTTLTDTATLHASGTATSSHHHTNPASSSQQSSQPTQPSAHRKRTEPH